jgi:Putative transposase
VTVLSALFRRLLLEKLTAAHAASELKFFGKHAQLADTKAFAAYLKPLRNSKWVVYCKHPAGGPEEVLRYLARYTHRVAISNRRLIACDDKGVTFKWKDYRIEGPDRYKVMTLPTHEFIRRFLMHVLPAGFHRIRYYGLLASGHCHAFSITFTTAAFDRSSLWLFEASPYRATPKGEPSYLVQHDAFASS